MNSSAWGGATPDHRNIPRPDSEIVVEVSG